MDYLVTGPDGKQFKVTADNPEALDHAVGQMFGAPAPAPSDGVPIGEKNGTTFYAGTGNIESQATPPAAAPQPAAAPSPDRSLVDKIMTGAGAVADTAGGLGTQAVVGARQGVAGLAGLPVDATTLAVNLAGKASNGLFGTEFKPIEHPTGGSEDIDAMLASPARLIQAIVGKKQEDPAPDGMAERMTRRIAQEAGAAAVPVGGALLKAGQVGIQGARELPALARSFVEPAAVDAGKFVGKQAKAATAAGAGAGVVNEATGKARADAEGRPTTTLQKLGDFGGALTGLGISTVGSKLADVGKTVYGAMTGNPKAVDATIRDVAVDEIARAAGLKPNAKGVIDTDPLAKAVNEGTRVDETIPGFQESTADRTKNAGLAAMEYSRQSGPNAGLYAGRRTANTDAIDTQMGKSEPQGQPGSFSAGLEAERDARLTDAASTRASAEDTARTATAPLQSQGTPAMRGGTIRNELDTARDTSRTATAEAYERAGINNNPLQPTELAQALDEVTARLPHADRVDTPQGLIDRIAQLPAGEPLTMREATALKTRLLGLQEAAAAQPGGRNAARVLGYYIDATEGVIQRNISPEQQAALGEARTARRTEGDAFDRKGDPVRDILAANPGGRPKMRDENVANLATRDDVVGRLLTEADTPATRTAIRNELLSRADTSTAAGLHEFQQQYAQQIARFPGLNDELGAAIRARVSENTARGAEGGLLKDIGREGRGVVSKYLQYGDENATRAMTAVMKSKDPARSIDELLSFVGDDPKAVDGARKVFWDIMQKQTRSEGSTTKTINGTQPYLPAALERFTSDPATAAVAERLYRANPEHWDNIKKIAEAIQGVDVRNAAKAPNSSGTPQALAGGFMPSPEALQSRIFAVERGVVSPAYAALNIVSIMARKAMRGQQVQAVNQAIDHALLDPEWAAQILKENNPVNRAALRTRARGWMGKEAGTLVDMLQPEDKDADTKKAAMK